MSHSHDFVYCYRCHATTRWELNEGEDAAKYQCRGDRNHPERRVHGCGTEISEVEFLARREAVKHVGQK